MGRPSTRLIELRLNRGWTIRDAAEAIGVANGTYGRAEQGIRPRPASAKKIADFFEVQVTDLWPVEDVAA